jgi:AraC family transcriptional regulator
MDYTEGIEKIKEYIKEHLTDELSAESIAREAGYSVFHFCRIFKEGLWLVNRSQFSSIVWIN